MNMVRLCIYLFLFVFSFSVTLGHINCDESRNGQVECRLYCTYSYLTCKIYTNDTELIKSQLKLCSEMTEGLTRLNIQKRTPSELGKITVDIDLPENIKYLYLYGSYSKGDVDIKLKTSTYNSGLTYIRVSTAVELEPPSFFNYFEELKIINLYRDVYSEETPSFTNLQHLTYLRGRFQISGEPTIDNSMVSGLENLVRLYLQYSNFERIEQDAFQGLRSLTRLYLLRNGITRIEEGAFNSLHNLRFLSLDGNGIEYVTNNVFQGLSKLTYLDLDKNPNFPLDTLLQTRNLINLAISYNNYPSLDPFVFQQMKELTYVYAYNPFICDCRMQWAPVAYQNGMNIYGECLEPSTVLGTTIISQSLYTNCTRTQSYNCFSNSISCPNNEICLDSNTSYTCGCPMGYVLRNFKECYDIDECESRHMCDHRCVNTEGSYICTCQDGYILAPNGYDCEDVNECLNSNGGCEIGCGNTIGSYQCYCEFGHLIYNKTLCMKNSSFEELQEKLTLSMIMYEKLKIEFQKLRNQTHFSNATICKNTSISITSPIQNSPSTVISFEIITSIGIVIIVIETTLLVIFLVYSKVKAKNKSSQDAISRRQENIAGQNRLESNPYVLEQAQSGKVQNYLKESLPDSSKYFDNDDASLKLCKNENIPNNAKFGEFSNVLAFMNESPNKNKTQGKFSVSMNEIQMSYESDTMTARENNNQ